jgi:DNA-binding CsgD family transcriptional regulator/tetratricopeptide (TPR) repeat protein
MPERSATEPARGDPAALDRVDELLAGAADGRGGFVVLRGAAAARRGALLDDAAARADALGFVVVRGGGSASSARPFGVVLDALASAGLAIDATAFDDRRAPDALVDIAFRVTGDVIDQIERRCQITPVAVIVDDLHDCDGGSLRALRSLGLRASGLSLAVLAGERDDDAPGLLDSAAETVMLVGDASSERDPDLEPIAAADMVELSGEARAVLRAAAVLGDDAALDDIAALAGCDRSAVERVARQLVPLGFELRGENGGWTGAPARLAVIAAIPVAVLGSLHDEAADALAARGGDPVQVASHLAAGHGAVSLDALAWLREAAHACWTAEPQRAVAFLRRAAELASPLAPERDEVLLEMVAPLTWTGRHAEAEAAAREVLRRALDPATRRDASIELAMSLQHNGRIAEAAALWDEAGQELLDADPHRSGLLLATFGYNALIEGDVAQVRSRSAAALEHGGRVGHDGLLSTGEMLAALAELASGHAPAGAEHALRAVELGGDAWLGAPAAALVLALARLDLDDLDGCGSALIAGRALVERLGSSTYAPALHWAAVGHDFLAGRWDDALAGVEAGIELVDELGTPTGRALALSVRSVIFHHRGDLSAAATAVDGAEHSIIEHGPQLGFDWTMWARALQLEAAGNEGAADALLGNAWDVGAPVGWMLTSRVFAPDVVRLAVAHGDRTRAERVLSAIERIAESTDAPSARACALRCRGWLSASPECFDEAAEALVASPRLFERALANADAAVALAGEGSEGATGRADAALADFAAIGATRSADALAASLRARGVHRGGPRVARDDQEGPASLTDAEAKVARLVADGLTNREVAARLFISRHTVDSHLRRVFAKLGVASRVELVTAIGGDS